MMEKKIPVICGNVAYITAYIHYSICFLMLELQASRGAQAGPVSGLDEHGRDSAHEGNNSQTCQTST